MTDPDRKSRKSREINISRRLFFVGAIVGGTAAGVAAVSSPRVRETLFKKLDNQPLSERVLSEATSNRRSAIRTALETCLVWAANVGLGFLIDRLGIEHGGRAADGELYADQAEAFPVALYVRDSVVIPIIEEAFFRLVPSSFFSEEQPPDIKMHWGTGLTSAALFAAIHNFSKPEPETITLHLDSVPVEQFILGVYCWYAQRKGGFVHAAGAHVLYNNLCEGYWYFFESKLVEKHEQTEEEDHKTE